MRHFQLGRLHYIADHPAGTGTQQVLDLVSSSVEVGVRCVQLRCKGCTDRERYELAMRVMTVCRAAGATYLIDDRVDIALAVGADGAHVGAQDIPVAEARRLLGPERVLGATARTPAEAAAAALDGATYIGTGPCYATLTKAGLPPPIGPHGLAAVAEAVDLPVLAIGGIDAARLPEVLAAGAYGAAVISAIAAAPDPFDAARQLLATLDGVAA